MPVDLAALLANAQKPSTTRINNAQPLPAEGDFSRRANAGVFNDLFNLLGRTSRASATAVDYATDKDSNTSLLQGIKEGLSGKSQTNYADVLAHHGVKGPAGAVLGFVGDVALDPLTYLTLDFNKGLSKTAARIAATQTVGEEGALAIAKKAAELQAENPTHLFVKFAGKRITPNLNLPSIGATEAVQGTLPAKMFSRAAELPLGLAESQRVFEGGSAGKFSSHIRGIKETFVRNLTPEERAMISHAIETDSPLSNVPLIRKNGETAKGFRGGVAHPEGFSSLEDYRLLAKTQLRNMFEDEQAFGLLKPEQFRENYVPHFYKNPPADILPGQLKVIKSKVGGPDTESFMKSRKFEGTLAQAADEGWDPITDVADLLEIRAGKHHRTIGRAAFLEDAVNKFGTKLTEKNKKSLVGWYDAEKALGSSPIASRFKGIMLPEEVVRPLQQLDRVTVDGTTGSEFMRFFDKTMRQWKFLNTAVNPGYHVRNSFTDALMNFADGVVNPKYYSQARRILSDRNVNTTSEILGAVENLVPADEFITKVNINGKKLSSKDVWDAYVGSGAKSGFVTTELQRNTNALEKQGLARYAAQANAKLGDFSDTREDFFRLAHYLHALEQEFPKSKNFVDASVAAGKRVRKFNIDYGALSSFERNAVTRVIPFYSFMRKNLPLQMELLFTKPGFMATYPKGQDLLQGVLGTADDNGDYLVPEWIRNSAPVRVALAKQEANNPLSKFLKKFAGAGEGESVFLPTVGGLTPLQDVANVANPLNKLISEGPIAAAQEAAKTGVNMSTPFIKAPVEAAMGRSLYTGAPVDNWGQWLASQLGPTRTGYNLASGNQSKAWATLSGLPLQASTQKRQLGELERRNDKFEAQTSAAVENDPRFQKLAAILQERNVPTAVQQRILASWKSKLVSPQARLDRRNIQNTREALQG